MTQLIAVAALPLVATLLLLPASADHRSATLPRHARAGTVPAMLHAGRADAITHIDRRVLWSAGATVRLDGPVIVDAGGTLVIEAGTRIEGTVGSYLIVARDGRIEARGTLAEPIVLTCAATAKYPGCWGGVLVAGYARINTGTPTSPASARSASGDCLEISDPIAVAQRYGGCNDSDDSGILRYVRIEYAERALHLAGVGSGTVIADIQANRTRGDGILITGGAAHTRELFLTANGTGLRWTGGWRGRAQSIAVQQDVARFAAGIVGQNGTGASSATHDALPRSNPSLFNITLIAQSSPANPSNATARALVLERGTAGTIRNLLLFAPQIALDLSGDATCAQFAGGLLSLKNVMTAGATALGEGNVPAGCPAEASVLNAAADFNVTRVGALGLLSSENDLILPDLRPVTGSPLQLAAAATPPTDGFFSAELYVGAIPPKSGAGSIPWFSGWTSPAPAPAPIPNGTITGVVRSPVRGSIANARVTDVTSGETVLSGLDGTYTLTLPAGTAFLDVTMLPADCELPLTQTGPVRPNVSTTLNLTVTCPPLPGTERIAAGNGFACGIADQGTYCWGSNAFGELGVGNTTPSALPAGVNGNFTSLSAGARHMCARDVTGIVRCWGDNAQGQLGDGTTFSRLAPAAGPGGPFQVVTSGDTHTCALGTDGTAFCWGANTDGQLGNGSLVRSLSPVAVTGAPPFATIAAGANHTCALDRTGAAWCWGDNTDGQLGDGTTADRTRPVAVSGGVFYSALAGGGDTHSCALELSGVVRCWGANDVGQLGVGATAPVTTPIAVPSSVAFTQLTLGDRHTCGIGTDAVAYCWGLNAAGQIGDNSLISRTSPMAVAANARFNKITGGTAFNCGVTFGAVTGEDNVIVFSRRSLLCWGSNTTGQFGRGSTTSALTPTAAATGLTFP
jgi:alpha-tubulin suppressor-like RCC1 family protein